MGTNLQSWKRSIRRISISVVTIYMLVCTVLFWFQRSLLYFPSHHAGAGRLEPWIHHDQVIGYKHSLDHPQAVWLMMHGNGGQASDREYVLPRLSPSDALYVLEYPGYGARSGKPSEDTFNAAALDAYDQLSKLYPDTPLCVLGESIGSGPACQLTGATRKPDKIVLVVPFDTLYQVAARRFFFLPVWLLLLDRWDNIDALSSYDGPVEIIAAKQDEVIPYHHAKALAEACPTAELHTIRGGHNDWSYDPAVRIQH